MKIKIHYSMIILLLVALYTRLYKEIGLFFLIIMIHEFSHVFIALIFRQKVSKITITALGGIADINMNTTPIKQVIIASAGIISNVIMLLIAKYYSENYYFNILYNYNLLMIIFNSAIIFPLDGFHILENLLKLWKKPSKEFKLITYISLTCLVIFFTYSIIVQSLGFIIIALFLLYKNITRIKEKEIIVLKNIINNIKMA